MEYSEIITTLFQESKQFYHYLIGLPEALKPYDSGPIYRETNMARKLVEPWNTFSNLGFLAIILFWSIRVYRKPKSHVFISFTLPILLVGFIGGTIYHATRSHEVWLLMDWLPILILSLTVAVYFYVRSKIRWYWILLAMFSPFLIMSAIHTFDLMPTVFRRLLGYPVMAATILIPIILHIRKSKGRNAVWIVMALVSFIIAIFFRSIDASSNDLIPPMGTHWLWHVFGSLASHLLIVYIFRDDEFRLQQQGDSMSNMLSQKKQNLVS